MSRLEQKRGKDVQGEILGWGSWRLEPDPPDHPILSCILCFQSKDTEKDGGSNCSCGTALEVPFSPQCVEAAEGIGRLVFVHTVLNSNKIKVSVAF